MKMDLQNITEQNRDKFIYIFLLAYAVLVMLFCAGSSPLIRYLSPDSSIFYTMGRSAANGTVLYKEIADHKGFYLFFFNWIGAWLTPNSMNGLLLVEICFAWCKLICVYQCAFLFIKDKKKSLLSAMLFLAAATNFFSWNTGNLGEQFALAFQLISFYFMARYMEENRRAGKVTAHKAVYMFIHGVCACIVLFIQANLIAMWIPFGIGLAIVLLKEKYFSNFFRNLGALLGGIAAAAAPVVLYGMLHHCIEDMYYVMFEINFLYSKDGRTGITLLSYLKDFILQPSMGIVILALLGVAAASCYYKKRYFTWTFCGMLLFTVICMSVSLNANPIYYTTYLPFAVPFVIWIVKKIQCLGKYFYVTAVAVFLLTVMCNLQLAKKVFHIGASGYAYESAEKMGDFITDKNADVLVLGNSLYYNCTGTLPHIKYFTIFGSGLRYETFPYCIDEQYASLVSGENDYVIIQFTGEDYAFWGDKKRDEEMNRHLDQEYQCVFEYREGGIHSALYKKAGTEN